MATSSIFTSVKINDPQKAEAFIEALDIASKDSKMGKKSSTRSLVTDPDSIKKIIDKRIKK